MGEIILNKYPTNKVCGTMTEKHPGGRPSKITPELVEKITGYIKAGNYPEVAASLAGISRKTFYNWLKKGHEHKTGIHVEFLHSIKKAEDYAEAAAIERVRKSGADNWQALAWWLERKHPQKWGRKQQIDMDAQVKAKVDSNVKVNLHDEIKEAEDYFESINKQRKSSDMEDNPPK